MDILYTLSLSIHTEVPKQKLETFVFHFSRYSAMSIPSNYTAEDVKTAHLICTQLVTYAQNPALCELQSYQHHSALRIPPVQLMLFVYTPATTRTLD
jgi:hypothetical protein